MKYSKCRRIENEMEYQQLPASHNTKLPTDSLCCSLQSKMNLVSIRGGHKERAQERMVVMREQKSGSNEMQVNAISNEKSECDRVKRVQLQNSEKKNWRV